MRSKFKNDTGENQKIMQLVIVAMYVLAELPEQYYNVGLPQYDNDESASLQFSELEDAFKVKLTDTSMYRYHSVDTLRMVENNVVDPFVKPDTKTSQIAGPR